MCTVSFLARKHGYALAMNRDELLSRVAGLPPKRHRRNGTTLICPSEPRGGTWISLNDSGVTLALINWYSVKERVRKDPASRGDVVSAASTATCAEAVDAALGSLPLQRINAFRLIGIFPRNREVVEWQWNLKKLVRKEHRWRAQQWISSGFDEPGAQRVRSRTFRIARRQSTSESLGWLRRLHRSHHPNRSPYSTCMHRSDAATVSYTEVMVSDSKGSMRYTLGAPCAMTTPVVFEIELNTTNHRESWSGRRSGKAVLPKLFL